MTMHLDVAGARAGAKRLLDAWNSVGILGDRNMPEDLEPRGMQRASSSHALFLTLTVSIDYMRNADQLWDAARSTYEDPATQYVFEPEQVVARESEVVSQDLAKHKLAKKPVRDTRTWLALCKTFHEHYQGKIENLIAKEDWSAPNLIKFLQKPEHKSRFPYLRGPKISALWVRMMNDNWRGGKLLGLEQIGLPVDVHTGAATVMAGYVKGEYHGDFAGFRDSVQEVWRKACEGTSIYPLQLDEPLWHLSRNGCRRTRKMPCEYENDCPIAEHCSRTVLRVGGTKGDEYAEASFTTGKWERVH